MLGGLGHVVAEAAHDLQAHHVVVLFLVLFQGAALDLRIQVHAVFFYLQQPALVVYAGDLGLYGLVVLHAQLAQQCGGAYLHAVAQAHGLDIRVALHVAGQHGHGVGVVEEEAVGGDFFHVPGEITHHGDGPQRPEYAAYAQGVGDGLLKAELLGDLEVRDGAGLVAAHLYGVNYEVRALKGGLAVFRTQIGFDPGGIAKPLVYGFEHELALFQTLGVHVVQRDVGVGEGGCEQAVTQHVFGEHGGTRAHECDFRHKLPPMK